MTLPDMICCGLFYCLVWDVDREEHFQTDFPVDPIKQDILESARSSVGHISTAWLRLYFFDS